MDQIALLIVGALIKYGPDVATSVAVLLHKGDPTLEDWHALFAQVRTYDQIVAPKPTVAPLTPPSPAV